MTRPFTPVQGKISLKHKPISTNVGFNLFVLKSVVPGVTDNEVSNGAMIFVFPMLAAIAILTVFPDIALFLPRMLLTNK